MRMIAENYFTTTLDFSCERCIIEIVRRSRSSRKQQKDYGGGYECF